jgi:hypothetical protein
MTDRGHRPPTEIRAIDKFVRALSLINRCGQGSIVGTDNTGHSPIPAANTQRTGAGVVSLASYLERENEVLRQTIASLSRQTSRLRHQLKKPHSRRLAVARAGTTGNLIRS